MKRSTLQKQHATALRGARSCFLEGAPFLRYTLITKLAGVGKLLRFASRNQAYRTKSVCGNPYNTRYLLVL